MPVPVSFEPAVGQCFIVARNSGRHNVPVGSRLVVSRVDTNDSTVRGFVDGSATAADGWFSWSELEPVRFGVDYVKRHLPSHMTMLLAACDGIEGLALNPAIKLGVLETLPDLEDRILEAMREIDAGIDCHD